MSGKEENLENRFSGGSAERQSQVLWIWCQETNKGGEGNQGVVKCSAVGVMTKLNGGGQGVC